MTPQKARTLGEAFRKEMRRLFQEQQCAGPYGSSEQRDPIKFALTEFGVRMFAGIANALERYADELDRRLIDA